MFKQLVTVSSFLAVKNFLQNPIHLSPHSSKTAVKPHIALLTNNVKTRNIRVLDYRLRTIRLDIRAQHIDNSFETATVVAVQID